MLSRRVAGNLRSDAQADVSAPHLRERYGALASIGPVGLPVFAGPDGVDVLRQIPVPLDGVHRQIQMRVDYQHA